jgi:methylated-DNA-protein-cysteine methyltransferase related protein
MSKESMHYKKLNMADNSNFFEKVYSVTMLVPFGRVTTYGAIARYLGSAGSSRMVGWALNKCHSSQGFIPAHRVVNRKGLLSGKHHFGTPGAMQQLLENENVKVEDNKVVNFDELFWDPCKEI